MNQQGPHAGPRITGPRCSARHGRTWLTYRELDSPGLVHGLVVFRELLVGTPHDQWTASARDYLRQAPWASDLELVIPRQVHGTRILTLRAGRRGHPEPASSGNAIPEADGVVTDRTGVLIGVSVADCLPLLAVDSADGVIAAAHCGWRGIADGVVERLLEAIDALAGNRAARERTRYLVGASVGSCCYCVREDLLSRFEPEEVRLFASARGGRTYFDLKQVVAHRLTRGVARPADIVIDKTCTACNKLQLSSYRREGASCGRMLAVMARAPGHRRAPRTE